MLLLKKIKKDSTTSYHKSNFAYPEVGDIVRAPKWEVEKRPECNNIGLYGLPNGNGNWQLLEGDLWVVIECDDEDVVCFDSKCKFKQGKIVYKSEKPPVEYIDRLATNSEGAYWWARDIGNQDVMIDRVIESNWAYAWARYVGNQDVMINRVTKSEWAYWWASDIGNRDIMIERITELKWAKRWMGHFGYNEQLAKRFPELDLEK